MSSLRLLPQTWVWLHVSGMFSPGKSKGEGKAEGRRWSLVVPAESLECKLMGSSLYIKCAVEASGLSFHTPTFTGQEPALGATCLPGPESSSLEKEVTQSIGTHHSGSEEIVPSIQVTWSGAPVASTTLHPRWLRVTCFSVQTQPSIHRSSMSLLFIPGKIYKKRVM